MGISPHGVIGRRFRLLIQVAATIVILGWLPGNGLKLFAMVIVWALTFRRISRAEAVFVVLTCVLFTAMNTASLRQGIFAFRYPDILGMPVYELFMWGFYMLHTKRILDGPAPQNRLAVAWALGVLFALPFALVHDPSALLAVTATVLLVALWLFHEPLDIAYCGYMITLGAAIEYTGVHTGQWAYPEAPPGGVPLWFITMWGGVGLFLRRLAVPVLARFDDGAHVAKAPASMQTNQR